MKKIVTHYQGEGRLFEALQGSRETFWSTKAKN